MDVKSINTAGWQKPKKGSPLTETIEDEEELGSLKNTIYHENTKIERGWQNTPNTIEWITTWRKIVS